MENNYKILRKYFKVSAIGFALCSIINIQIIAQCPSISSISSTPTGCGSGNGTATVNASGGTGTLTYLWNPGGKSGSYITGLTAGTYTVTVRDANGCSATSVVTVAPPSGGPTIVIDSQKNLKCHGDKNGNAFTSATGGTGSYQYVWSTGVSGSGISSSITNIGAGTYTVTYTDKNNFCSSSKTITITEPPDFSINPNITNIKCKGNASGSIFIIPYGNTPPYTYDWLPVNQQTQNISGLSQGTFTLSIKDSQGCTATFSYTITEPATTVSVSTSSTTTSCGSNTGTATAFANGGTGTHTYSWNTGANTSSITSLAVGSYTVTVADNNGCTATMVATINNPSGPTVAGISNTDGTCGKNDGSAVVTVVGGTAPYTYSWTDGSTSATATNLASGTYSVTVTDAENCSSSTSVIINCVIGVDELNPVVFFSIYPNPTKSDLTIELEETLQNKKLHLQVYDNVGKKIMQQSVNNKTTQLATHNLAKGIYHLKLLDESNAVLGVQKFVVE